MRAVRGQRLNAPEESCTSKAIAPFGASEGLEEQKEILDGVANDLLQLYIAEYKIRLSRSENTDATSTSSIKGITRIGLDSSTSGGHFRVAYIRPM
jgi:hypothetical protein